MEFLIILGVISVIGLPRLTVWALLATIPASILFGLTAWSEYTSGNPPPDALYLSPIFWGIEVVGVSMLLYVIVFSFENLRHG